MADFRENFNRNFELAAEDPDLLKGLIPAAVDVFGADTAIAHYRNPASSELVERLGRGLTWLWMDVAEEPDLTKEHVPSVRAHTSRYDFMVTPTAMSGFRPQETTVELEGRALRPKFLITTITNSINILPDIEPPVAVYQRTRETKEFKYSFLRRPKIVADPASKQVAKLPASDKDIEAALGVIKWADPLRYPKNYKEVTT